MVLGSGVQGFRVWGLGFRGLGFRGLGFRVQGFGFWVQGGVWGFGGFRGVEGLGFSV